MKILVGNNAFENPGGSETYAYALIKELVRRGHTVSCIGKRKGMVSNKIEELGVSVHTNRVVKSFDLLLLSHSSSISLAQNCKGFRVQTCHGIFPQLEQPVKRMNAYVSITKEVELYLQGKNINSTIIWNGIDCERYKPVTSINRKLQTVLSLTHSKVANTMLGAACNLLGVKLIIHNKYNKPIWNIEEKINKADLVVSLGRGAYEAMACGRNVLIFDNRSYAGINPFGDGMVTKVNVPYYLRNNCSGRFSNKQFDVSGLRWELKKYNTENGKYLRKFALENLNISKQVDKYLNLMR